MVVVRSDADAVRACGVLLAAFADQLTTQRRRAHREFAEDLESARQRLAHRRARVDEARDRLRRAAAQLDRAVAATGAARAELAHAQTVDPRNGGAAMVSAARAEVSRAEAQEHAARADVENAERELRDRKAEAERCSAAVDRIDGAARDFDAASAGFSAFTLGVIGLARPRLGFLAAALDQYHATTDDPGSAASRPSDRGPTQRRADVTAAEPRRPDPLTTIGLSEVPLSDLRIRDGVAAAAFDSWAAERWVRVVSRILERGGDRDTLVRRDARDGALEPHTLANVWDWLIGDPITMDADGEVIRGMEKTVALATEGVDSVPVRRTG